MPDIIDPKGGAPNGATPASRDMVHDDDRSIKEWMDSLAGESAVRVQIIRKKPSVGPAGEAIAGILETVDDRVDDEYLRDTWGGGVYQLKVFRPNGNGNWVYLRARTISIAGPPKMAGVVLGGGGAVPGAAPISVSSAGGSDELVDRAMSALERSTQRAEARMERMEAERGRAGLDTSSLDVLLTPMRQELAAAREQARELQSRLYDVTVRPPPRDEFRDRLMERMIDGESARVESIRVQYEARLDRLRESGADEVKRLEARHADDLRRAEQQHDRAVAQIEKALDERTAALKLGYDMRLDAMKAQVAALERELTAAQAKVAGLEARKDQSLPDKAAELLSIREALEGLSGGAGAAAAGETPWYERALNALGSSEAVLALVNKVGGGGGGEQAPQPQLPPPGVPFRGPDGQVYVVGADGQPHRAQPRRLAAQAKRRRLAAPVAQPSEAPAAPPARPTLRVVDGGAEPTTVAGEPSAAPVEAPVAGDAGGEPIRAPDPREVRLAVAFLEGALRGGTSAEACASSARSLVPADVLRFIRAVGIDQFITTVVPPTSGLATQRGRNYVRAVWSVLGAA